MTTLTHESSHQAISKAKNIVLWAIQIALAAMFFMAGGSKLSGAEQMVQLYNAIGLGQWFRYLTGAIEVGSAILLLVPAFAGVGAIFLTCTMIGAVITHMTVLGGANPTIPLVLLVGSVIVAWGRKDKTMSLFGR